MMVMRFACIATALALMRWGQNHERSAAPRALNAYLLARSIAQTVGDRTVEADALHNIGHVHEQQGRRIEAAAAWNAWLKLAEEGGERADAAEALMDLGILYDSEGKLDQSLDSLRRSLALREQLGDQRGMSRALNSLGLVYTRKGDRRQAIESYQRSIQLKDAIGDKAGLVRTLSNLAHFYHETGDDDHALDTFERCLVLSESLRNRVAAAHCLHIMSTIFHEQGNFDRALTCLENAVPHLEAVGRRDQLAATFASMAEIYQHHKTSLSKAAELYMKSHQLFMAAEDKHGMALTLLKMASVHHDQRDFALAISFVQRSLSSYEALQDRTGTAEALNLLGDLHRHQGSYDKALEYLEKSLKVGEATADPREFCSTLNHIGLTHLEQGQNDQAVMYFERSLALAERIKYTHGIAQASHNLGHIYFRRGDVREAIGRFQKSLDLSEQLGDKVANALSLADIGKSYAALNEGMRAHRALEGAIELIESIRYEVAGGEESRQHFLEGNIAPYHAMVDLLRSENRTEEALTYAERAKGRVLLDVLHQGRSNITAAMTMREMQDELRLRSEITSLNTRIAEARMSARPSTTRVDEWTSRLNATRQEYETFLSELYAAHPELRIKRGESPAFSLNEAAELLRDPNSAALEFVVSDRTHLFVLTRDKTGMPRLSAFTIAIAPQDLENRVNLFRERIARRDSRASLSARELYDLLLQPAERELKGKRNLIIVPDDVLWDLPFQALQPRSDTYVIDAHSVSYAPSLTVLREQRMQKDRLRSGESRNLNSLTLLAMGNPKRREQSGAPNSARSDSLPSLPFAEEEVRKLSHFYGPSRSKTFIGAEAREDVAKTEIPRYRIAHLATHAVLNNNKPMYSQIVLAPSHASNDVSSSVMNAPQTGVDDGLLEAWEIMDMKLTADLIALSACDTARGRFGAGEGVIGLTWALFVAGCPSTVVSQWQVHDESTTDFMIKFHTGLQAANQRKTTSKAEALRQAALTLRKNPRYRDPYYWAPFVLIGDGR